MTENQPQDILKRVRELIIRVIKMLAYLPKNSVGFSIGRQVMDSVGSIGANIVEAQSARSKKEISTE